MIRRGAAMLVVLGLAAAACSSGAASGAARGAATTELTVFAAASLRTALDGVVPAYEAEQAGLTITLSTDSSAALRTKIEQGAPADVFLAADTDNPRRLAEAGMTTGRPVAFARNSLTVIVPADNPAGISSAADLARPGVRVIAAGDEVPITRYALEAVGNLGIEGAYAANVVSREDNVTAVVAKIELGEGDAAIVYVTDANESDAVRAIELPAAANVTATYAGVVVKASAHAAAGEAFLAWLAGPSGAALLAELGFIPPG